MYHVTYVTSLSMTVVLSTPSPRPAGLPAVFAVEGAMAATVAAPLPFTTGFMEALGLRGIRRASHVEGVFGGIVGDKEQLRARMREVVGPDVDEALVEEWILELEHFLPGARAQAVGDAERVARVDRIELEDTVRRKRRQDLEERPYHLPLR